MEENLPKTLLLSKKRNVQYLQAFLRKAGISKIIFSPGSRNAPLILSLTADPFFHCHSIIDERSAAFFALGIMQFTRKPVAICCSSGTALLNYYPAIAEAFYQNLPLLIISADRPEELIDQNDGQTIRQQNVFQAHLGASIQLSENHSAAFIQRKLNDAMWGLEKNKPVHINMPFAEPLYQTEQNFLPEISWIEKLGTSICTPEELKNVEKIVQGAKKIIIFIGHHLPDFALDAVLKYWEQFPQVVILSETTANISAGFSLAEQRIIQISNSEEADFAPDILFLIGGNIVSKKIKQFFRNHPPAQHFYFSSADQIIDTFGHLTHQIKAEPLAVLSAISIAVSASNYQEKWKNLEPKSAPTWHYSDAWVVKTLLDLLPENVDLHLGNSTIVRYVQYFKAAKKFLHYCNRGTSGIDGTVSTAVGFAWAKHSSPTLSLANQPVFLLLGDLSFFYDSNALWNHYVSAHLKIIILNNQGGGIFRLIADPKIPSFKTFFQTEHQRKAKNIAAEFGLAYFSIEDETHFKQKVQDFIRHVGPAILEIFTDPEQNDAQFRLM